jgi:hypothetical protein
MDPKKFALLATRLVLAVWILLAATLAFAERPPVEFDVPCTIAASEVVSPTVEVAADQKLIAIVLRVSTFVSPQLSTTVDNVVVAFDSPSATFQVVDFFPKTTLDSRFSGPVAVKTVDDRRLSLDFDATGFYKCLTGTTLTGSFSDGHSFDAAFELLPPKEVVAASGTIQRGRGVYFKLRPSANETIEGAKELLIVARVPRAWRADSARVRCTATGERPSSFLVAEHSDSIAQRDFLVGLHLQGDAEAKRAADQLASGEQILRAAIAEHRAAIERKPSPAMLRKLGIVSHDEPAHVTQQLLFGQMSREEAQHLPKPVIKAAANYALARAQLRQLAGQPAAQTAQRTTVARD